MSVLDTFAVGIAPDHWPALVAAVALPGVVRLAQRVRAQRHSLAVQLGQPVAVPARPVEPVALVPRLAGWLLGLSAAIHLALPLGHHDEPLLLAGFLGSGVAYAWLALRAARGRSWKTLSALLIVATLIAYLIVLARGGEEPDQVGIATAMIELLALALCLIPSAAPSSPAAPLPRRAPFAEGTPFPGAAGQRRKLGRRITGSIGFVLVVVVFGTVLWLEAFVAHGDTAQVAEGGHHHGHAARAQAGIVMTPVGDEHPTGTQVVAAAQLADRTKAELLRYTDIRAALAAGYAPTLKRTGLDVHLENKAYGKDGKVLDPSRPEMLMYAIADGKATLLSAVYTVPVAGRDAPTPGGPLTRWHSHNVCLSAIPPGYSIVDVYGTCPPFSITVTVAQMMHVWVVDNPGGPYADSVPDSWTREFNRTNGLPFTW